MIFLQGSIWEERNGWLNGQKGDLARVSSDIMENMNTNLSNVRGMNSMVLEYIKWSSAVMFIFAAHSFWNKILVLYLF